MNDMTSKNVQISSYMTSKNVQIKEKLQLNILYGLPATFQMT